MLPIYIQLGTVRPAAVGKVLPDPKASTLRFTVLLCLSGAERRHKARDTKGIFVLFCFFLGIPVFLEPGLELYLKEVITVALCRQATTSNIEKSSEPFHFC